MMFFFSSVLKVKLAYFYWREDSEKGEVGKGNLLNIVSWKLEDGSWKEIAVNGVVYYLENNLLYKLFFSNIVYFSTL